MKERKFPIISSVTSFLLRLIMVLPRSTCLKILSTWSDSNSVDEITGFDVLVNGQKVDGTNATTQHYELYGLVNNTAFTFQVSAVFTTGSTTSPLFSDQLSVSTSDRSKPGVMGSPELLAVTGGFIQVRALPPSDTGGANLLNLTVVVRREDDLRMTSLGSHGLQDPDFTLFEFYGLDALTTYVLSAFTINADGLTSTESGARIKGYNVYMATNDTSDFTAIATTVNTAVIDVVEILHSTELEDEPLLPETRYLFKAVAVTLDTGGGLIVGYRIYRDYELLTPRYVLPPYTDCGGLTAETQYMYGVTAINGSLEEGTMASTVMTTAAVSIPSPPLLSLTSRAVDWLNVSVTPACDSGGDSSLSYQYKLEDGGIAVQASYFSCCTFRVEGLEANRSYAVFVRAVNSASSSPWIEAEYATTTGVPATPDVELLQVNSYSAIIALSSSADREILSYELNLRYNGEITQTQAILCETILDFGQIVCPGSYRLETLEPGTAYEVELHANGPLGSSASAFERFQTNELSEGGIFGMDNTEYFASVEGVISTTVHRANGTAGSVLVGLNVSYPDTVVLRCDALSNGGCQLESFDISALAWQHYIPVQGTITFSDQQTATTIWIELLDNVFYEENKSLGLRLMNQSTTTGTDVLVTQEIIILDDESISKMLPTRPANLMIVRVTGAIGTVPEPPPPVELFSQPRAGTLTLFIKSPLDTGGLPLIDYALYMRIFQTTTTTDIDLNTESELPFTVVCDVFSPMVENAQRTCVVNRLLADTSYELFATCANSMVSPNHIAPSWYSLPGARAVFKTATAIELPSAPLNLRPSSVSAGNMNLEWDLPFDFGGAADVIGYIVYQKFDYLSNAYFTVYDGQDSPTRNVAVRGLTRNATYAFELNLSVQVADDLNFQYVPDSIAISFDILKGGVQYGTYSSSTLTAVDDGDISMPKQCSDVQQVLVTGGSLGLQWMPPVDRGGANVTLQYLIDFMVDGKLIISHAAATENETVYGLNESTTYSVSIRAVNSAGPGLPTTSLLLATLMATPATAPCNMQVLATSSSSALISWDPPLDDGGSKVVSYTIFNVSGSGSLTPFSSVQCSVATICVIKQLLALTTYNIRIQASTAFVTNGLFSDIIQFNTSTPDIPDTPPEPDVSWVSAGAMTVQMFDPVNIGGSYIQQYRLFMRADDDLDFTLVYDGELPEYTVYRLRRDTIYWVKYQVANSVGFSPLSPLKAQETLDKSLPGPPVDVLLANRTGGAITLTWNEPLDVADRDISGYTVLVYPNNSDMSSFVGYDGKGVPTREGTVYGLTANTTYGMEVLAYSDVSNCFDTSLQAPSAIISVSTLNATPPRMPELIVGRHTGGIIELVWTTPKDKGGIPLTGFQLFAINFNGTGSSQTLFSTNDTSVLSFTHNNLTAATDYSYAIRASNAAGNSSNSSVLTTVTDLATPPSAPLNVRQFSYKTGGAVEIGWDPPFDTGGQPIAGYMIYRNGEPVNGEIPSTARTFLDKSRLVASTGYAFTVRAVSASLVVSGASEVCIASTTTATMPQKLLSLSANPGSSFLNVTWISDGDTGGLPVTRYEVWLMCGSTLIANYSVTDSYFIFTGLTAQTVYNCSARVYNGMGSSETLAVNLTTTNVSSPSSPDAPLVVAVFGGNFTIELEPPLYTGGSAITAMKVYEQNFGSEVTVKLSVGVPGSYTFVGVTAESDYSITCSAINFVGEGSNVTTGTIVFENQQNQSSIAIQIINDAVFEYPDETFNIRLSAVSGTAKLGANQAVTVTIVDDGDAGYVSFEKANYSFSEATTSAVVSIVRGYGSSGRITLQFVYSGGTATIDYDYRKSVGPVIMEDGVTRANLTFSIINDKIFEFPNEYFFIQMLIESGGAKAGQTLTQITILDDGDISEPGTWELDGSNGL
ncbi:hypothetical protein BBJ28_00001219 [Nothophytophthora sp. Chile5]|nr:hypothetical protein BBJ28_00001219 [Nothophytophthora sp. Chile5]